MIFLQLFLVFVKIGALSFGGGYAMIPFFEKEIAINGWTQAGDYTRMIALAQVFPGPFAIDSSAYIGYQTGGLTGALIASAALSLPSFIALIFITRFYLQFKSNRYIQMLLGGVRPIVIGMLAGAVYILGLKPFIEMVKVTSASMLQALVAIFLIGVGYLILKKTRINPVVFILIFGVIGIAIF
jgi:chromate transporter